MDTTSAQGRAQLEVQEAYAPQGPVELKHGREHRRLPCQTPCRSCDPWQPAGHDENRNAAWRLSPSSLGSRTQKSCEPKG
eukprot:3906060-Alexandrium_andersonii.AAC.1